MYRKTDLQNGAVHHWKEHLTSSCSILFHIFKSNSNRDISYQKVQLYASIPAKLLTQSEQNLAQLLLVYRSMTIKNIRIF